MTGMFISSYDDQRGGGSRGGQNNDDQRGSRDGGQSRDTDSSGKSGRWDALAEDRESHGNNRWGGGGGGGRYRDERGGGRDDRGGSRDDRGGGRNDRWSRLREEECVDWSKALPKNERTEL